MKHPSLALLALGLGGCIDKPLGDTGGGTCCTFACDDGTAGQVSFTVDDGDCALYADDQCSVAGSATTSSSYADAGC